MTKKIQDGIIYLLPSLVGAILPIISLPLFTRLISIEDFGALALCQAYAIFINGISNFGLNLGYERNFFEDQEEKKGSLLFTTILFIFFTYLLFGLSTYLYGVQISQFLTGQIKYSNLLIISYFATGMTALKSFYLIYFKNSEQAKKFVVYTLDETIISFVISLILVFYLKIGVSGIVIAQLTASGIVFFIMTIHFLKKFQFSINFPLFKKSLLVSIPLIPRIFFGIIGAQFDKYILGVVASVELVGIYSLGQRVAGIIFSFMTAIQNVWSPVVYKFMFDKSRDGRELIGSYLNPFFYVSMFAGLLVTLFSEEIIFILSPIEYYDASKVVIILAILNCTYFFGKQNQLLFAKKTHLISILTLIGITLNVFINFIFVKLWGLMGIAWGNLLSGSLSGIISFLISQKYYRIKWDYKIIGLIFSVYFVSTLIIFFMIENNIIYHIRLILKWSFVILFLYIGFKTKIITRQKYNVIKHIIFKRFKLNVLT